MAHKLILVFSIISILTPLNWSAELCREPNLCNDGSKCCETRDGIACCPQNSVCCDSSNGCCAKEKNKNKVLDNVHDKENTPPFLKIVADEVKIKKFKVRTMVNEVEDLKSSLGRRFLDSLSRAILDIFCPGRKQKCPKTYTCCMMANEKYGCCPYTDAVCCPDFVHCCPSYTACNVTTMACIPFKVL